MKINSDFNKRVVVHSTQLDWLESPMKGVYRRPLDRIGAEVARATTIVKYTAGSEFSPHIHTGGEEFFVLEGVFQDEHGDYPAGSYLRNPPESKHTPRSEAGCIMLVKLWQFRPTDKTHIQLNSNFMYTVPHRNMKNVAVMPLYKDQYEEVSIQQWHANSNIKIESAYGLEILVLSGDFSESGDDLSVQSWLRLPVGAALNATTGSKGAKVWVKQNHLKNVNEQIQHINNIKYNKF